MRLPDINLWLALTFEAHAHHPVEAAWFESVEPEGAMFCRFTQQGFLRLATNASVFDSDALTLAGAWSAYDALLSDERVSFVAEAPGLESAWREHTTSQSPSHRVWSDAYLAAFSRTAGLELVSFDKGFDRYASASLRVTVLPVSASRMRESR